MPSYSTRVVQCLMLLVIANFCLAKAPYADIKLAYLHRILYFVKMPNVNKKINICFVGSELNIKKLRKLSTLTIKNNSIQARKEKKYDEKSNCNVYYIENSNHFSKDRLMKNEKNLLIVNSKKSFENYGHIHLKKHKSKIVFDINVTRLKKSNIFVSAELMEAANKLTGI